MTAEHRLCDGHFAEAERAVADRNWQAAEKSFAAFSLETLLHFRREEEILFPAFETQTGSTMGPTHMMRIEHTQLRGLIDKLARALNGQDRETYLSVCESTMIMLQQHNMKEEQMLYAMCDRMITGDSKESVLSEIRALQSLPMTSCLQ